MIGRILLPAAALLVLASCVGHYGDEPVEPRQPKYDRSQDDMRVAIPESTPVQYIPFCVVEQRMVGRWSDSLGEAESRGSEHSGKTGCREWTILWREKPGALGRAKADP